MVEFLSIVAPQPQRAVSSSAFSITKHTRTHARTDTHLRSLPVYIIISLTFFIRHSLLYHGCATVLQKMRDVENPATRSPRVFAGRLRNATRPDTPFPLANRSSSPRRAPLSFYRRTQPTVSFGCKTYLCFACVCVRVSSRYVCDLAYGASILLRPRRSTRSTIKIPRIRNISSKKNATRTTIESFN